MTFSAHLFSHIHLWCSCIICTWGICWGFSSCFTFYFSRHSLPFYFSRSPLCSVRKSCCPGEDASITWGREHSANAADCTPSLPQFFSPIYEAGFTHSFPSQSTLFGSPYVEGKEGEILKSPSQPLHWRSKGHLICRNRNGPLDKVAGAQLCTAGKKVTSSKCSRQLNDSRPMEM